MKQTILLLTVLLLNFISYAQRKESGNLVYENIPDIPASLNEKLQQYQNMRSAGFADWGPAGNGIFISTRFGDVAQIHYVSKPEGMRKQLTFFKEPVGSAMSCPDPDRKGFLYLKDVGGNENYQVHYYDMDSQKHLQLTDGKSRNERSMWHSKGEYFVYTSNQRSAKDVDIWTCSIADTSKRKNVYKGEGGGWGFEDWSDDGKQMIIRNYVSINESHIYLLDAETGKAEEMIPSAEKISYGDVAFAKHAKGIFFVSDEGAEFARLKYYDMATKKISVLTSDISWDVDGFSINKAGNKIAFRTNEGGWSKLYLMDVPSMKYTPVTSLPQCTMGGIKFNLAGDKIAITITTPTAPSDVYVLSLSNLAKPERWTFSETGGINTANFVQPSLIQYPTFDSVNGKQRMIPAFVYKPKSAKGKMPVIINIHGGPEGQSKPAFAPIYQYMASEMGIAVVVPNVRGSTGYGKTYVALDNGYLRENSVKDIGALIDWIAAQPNLDASRIAVWGGSYGGYMTLASMTHYNAKLKCGIDVVGISNFVTFLKSTAEYRRDLRRVEYGDERDAQMEAFLQKISPSNNVQKISKPMFIVQGKNDPRVPVTEAEQMVEAIKKNGSPVWYLMAKDEGHGFRKKSNNDFYTASMMLFLENYLIK